MRKNSNNKKVHAEQNSARYTSCYLQPGPRNVIKKFKYTHLHILYYNNIYSFFPLIYYCDVIFVPTRKLFLLFLFFFVTEKK